MAAAATTNEARERIIRDLPLLARLPADDVRALASTARLRSFASGATVFREGEPGDSLYVVVEGHVRIVVGSSTGNETTVAIVGPGDCFGEFALLDGRPRSASAVAAEATRTFVVTREAFVTWLTERPAAALALLETMSVRLRRADETIADMVFLDLPHRLAKHLLPLADGPTASGGRIAITQGEIASMLGVSRESVNKQLNLFARAGWITLGRGSVTLREPEGLRGLG
ncbi:MAG: Crp/Fnr family transcriptional regulator [Tepidiformaceae bacterium]